MINKVLFAMFLLLSTAFTPYALACGSVDVCDDASNSFYGHIMVEGITLNWSTDDENAEVDLFSLIRHDCGTCSTTVTNIAAVGSCGINEDYSHFDAAGDSGDSYTLEVWGGGARKCEIFITP